MLVNRWMSKTLVFIDPDASVIKAQILLKEKIRQKASILYLVDHRENTREVYVNDKFLRKIEPEEAE